MHRPTLPIERKLEHFTSRAVAALLVGASCGVALFQIYFLRELLAAEVLLGLIFVPLLTIVAIMYTIGAISEWGVEKLAVKAHSSSRPAVRGRNPF